MEAVETPPVTTGDLRNGLVRSCSHLQGRGSVSHNSSAHEFTSGLRSESFPSSISRATGEFGSSPSYRKSKSLNVALQTEYVSIFRAGGTSGGDNKILQAISTPVIRSLSSEFL